MAATKCTLCEPDTQEMVGGARPLRPTKALSGVRHRRFPAALDRHRWTQSYLRAYYLTTNLLYVIFTVMDDLDRKIAGLLQTDNRLSNAEIGAAVGLSVSAANERVRRLNSSGVIRGNHAVLDPDHVELPLCAFVFIDLVPHPDEGGFRAAIAARPEIQEVHQVAGAHCYLVKIRVSGTRALQRVLTDHIKSQPDVLRTETVMVLETIKETSKLALTAPTTIVPERGER